MQNIEEMEIFWAHIRVPMTERKTCGTHKGAKDSTDRKQSCYGAFLEQRAPLITYHDAVLSAVRTARHFYIANLADHERKYIYQSQTAHFIYVHILTLTLRSVERGFRRLPVFQAPGRS